MPLPREEILAKRARLLEVKRQRELREKELDKPRQSVAVHEEVWRLLYNIHMEHPLMVEYS